MKYRMEISTEIRKGDDVILDKKVVIVDAKTDAGAEYKAFNKAEATWPDADNYKVVCTGKAR